MVNPAGLRDQACRYQREAHLASAEAMDLRIALAHMGVAPTQDQVLMSLRFDEAAKGASDRAQSALQFLLFQQTTPERADELRATARRIVDGQRELRRRLLKEAYPKSDHSIIQPAE